MKSHKIFSNMNCHIKNSSVEDVIVYYTNYKGETRDRFIRPLKIWFGSNEWHTEPQWLLDVIDLEKNVERTFALNSIHQWQSAVNHITV